MSTQTNAAANDEFPVLPRCVNPEGIFWTAIWYVPTCAPSFPVCAYCYEKHIQPTPHAGLFEAVWLKGGDTSLLCQWNTPRVMAHLAAGDWDAINAFMIERGNLPDCKGPAGHTGLDGSRWYGMIGAWEIQGFVICETCYHELVAWNQLRSYFATTPTIKSDASLWTCDAAVVPLIKEGLRRAIASPNRWDELHRLFRSRMEYPSCLEMKNLQASSTHWYACKAVPDLVVCTACYLDHFVLDYDSSWEFHSLTPEQQQQQFDCGMQTLQIHAALGICKQIGFAANTDEYDGFETLARMILESPPCDTDDMRNATWYAPKGCTLDVYAICRRCLLGFMAAPGFALEFKEVEPRRGGNRLCDPHPTTPRFKKYLTKYAAAVKLADFSIFSEYVLEWAPLPECPRNEAYTNRKWYGKGCFTACALCYKEVMEGTSLASHLDCAVVPNENRCQMYSPRMRNLWRQACEHNDLDSFLVLAKERMNALLLMNMERNRQFAEMSIRASQRNT
ncbi:hypothetical protein AFCA_002280 [Aspergillus flavus]|uniref:Integral membrane protein n=1 Tax=Aspergillus flavus TaxID=5059 RepID=A0AB74BZH3_ASPFL|nr:integral membrane protein [Aspergillus flavus]UDD54634.1 hypothetical protein AFCA_002280 [Aspergillus flavus]